jgi:hypothetical protein
VKHLFYGGVALIPLFFLVVHLAAGPDQAIKLGILAGLCIFASGFFLTWTVFVSLLCGRSEIWDKLSQACLIVGRAWNVPIREKYT